MVEFLGKLFIKDRDNVTDKEVRRAWGTLSGILGIVLNVLLFAGKFTVGTLFGALSISADAINNLSDAGSQIISLVSIRIAAKPADRKHPFGHARMEYIASMIVGVLIIIVGISTLRDAIEKIVKGGKSDFSWLSVIVLAVSILVKLWMAFYNKKIGRKINSSVIEAAAADSLSDVIGTSAVLVALLIYRFTGFDLDAYLGIAVSLLILRAGVEILREMIDRLLGEGPDPEFAKELTGFAMSHEGILGVHDMMIHGYGPNMAVCSFHAEVDGAEDVFVTHDIIDNIEVEIFEKYGVMCTVHLDPIVTDDDEINETRELVKLKMAEIDPSVQIHDFRMVRGETHTNLIFDIAAPFELKMTDDEIMSAAAEKMKEVNPKFRTVNKVDRGINDY